MLRSVLSLGARQAPLFVALALSTVACSSSASSGADAAAAGQGPGATGSGAAGTTSGGPGGGGVDPETFTTFETEMSLTVESGDERTECITRRLGNEQGAFVRRFHATLSAASHHMIVYRTDATEEQLDPKPCQGFSGLLSGDHPIFIAQQTDATLIFPNEGDLPVALEILPNQMLLLEMHYINATPEPIDAKGNAYIMTIPLDANVIKSDLGFYGTQQGVNLPPNMATSTGVKFQRGPEATKSFALTTHQHHLGTRMQVWHSTGPSDTSKVVADSTNWSDPPLEIFDPPLDFPDGAKMGFAYQCDWNNTTPQTVTFGESFNDEMCFLWHYYYPSQGFLLCVDGFCL